MYFISRILPEVHSPSKYQEWHELRLQGAITLNVSASLSFEHHYIEVFQRANLPGRSRVRGTDRPNTRDLGQIPGLEI